MLGTYMYGIIRSQNDLVFDVVGIDTNYDQVHTVRCDGFAAIVSPSSRLDFRGLERGEATSYLVRHQHVVEKVMEDFQVLPVKFGTVLADENQVHRTLEQGQELFRETFATLADRVQMEVLVLWELQDIFEEIGREEPIAQLKAELMNRPAEEIRDGQIALGKMVQASLERRRSSLQERILSALKDITPELITNPLMDDSMVVNTALLLDGEQNQLLDETLDSLDKEFDGQLTFRCVGPLPPYSFGTMLIRAPSFSEIDEARRLLGLGDSATCADIRQSYRQMASQLHPDHNIENEEAESQMAELIEAYELLTSYAQSAPTETVEEGCSFDRESVEQVLLIAVEAQEDEE